MDEKNVVEEVAETVIVDEKGGVFSDIWNGIKKNWVQGLIGLGTAALTFAGGYFLGSNRDRADSAEPEPNPEEPPFVEGGDLI